MKQQIVNLKITMLTFAVMVFISGIAGIGSAHFNVLVHFHHDEAVTRSIPDNTAVGTNIGAPVSAHDFPDGTLQSGDPKGRYILRGDDAGKFNIDSQTGQLAVGVPLDGAGSTYSVKVVVQVSKVIDRAVVWEDADEIEVTINEIAATASPAAEADALPGVSSEERARIAGALAMDRVIFNELRNAATDTDDWVELRNVSDTDVTLNGWEVRIVTGERTGIVTFPSGTVLPAGGLLLLVNTDPDAPEMPLSRPEGAAYPYIVDADLILPQTNFTLLLRSDTGWEDSVGNYFFGFEIPPTAPPLTMDAAWYRARPDVLGYQTEAWVMSGYQEGTGYDVDVPAASALGTPGYSHTSLTADVNGDGTVNILDLVFVASRFDEKGATAADVNGDGTVNIQDLVLVSEAFGQVVDTQ